MAKQSNSELIRGNLDLMVLSSLVGGPQYGYLIQQRLNDAGRGLIAIQAGTLYPILHKLESEKLVKCRWDESTGRKRKWYELTGKGSKRLEQRAIEWRDSIRCLQEFLGPVLNTLPEPA